MARPITIRAEQAGDSGIIADLVRRAYADVPYSDHREHLMIDRLRATAAYLPALSLLAEIDGIAAGHILLTKAQIRNAASVFETLALAPLSVAPAFQRQGVGRSLIEAEHDRAAALGFGSILLVGIPDYYPQFGYAPLAEYPITLPFDAPPATCLIRALAPGALTGVAGRVDYAPGWLDH